MFQGWIKASMCIWQQVISAFGRSAAYAVEWEVNMENVLQEMRAFMNENMQLTAMPAKYKKKLMAYYYLAVKIESGKQYTESEINDVLNQWTTFGDPATLRREMYNRHLLNRTSDGKYYWKEEEIPSLEEFIARYI